LRAVPAPDLSDPSMSAYLEKVCSHAYAVTDADVDAVKQAGFSEDEIFEQTVAVAVQEGLRRLDAGLGDAG
jgi:alkylhydroperoxidase family enzyme